MIKTRGGGDNSVHHNDKVSLKPFQRLAGSKGSALGRVQGQRPGGVQGQSPGRVQGQRPGEGQGQRP